MREKPVALADYRVPQVVFVRIIESLLGDGGDQLPGATGIGFRSAPDRSAIVSEWRTFVDVLAAHNVKILEARTSAGLSLYSLYIRDTLVLTQRGLLCCRMTKSNRVGEIVSVLSDLQSIGIEPAGTLPPDARLEGGDVISLSDDICAVGIS